MEDEAPRKRIHFSPLKTAKVDAKGRFYLPGMVVDQLFADVPENEREVMVYLGPDHQILLRPLQEVEEV